MQTPVVNGCLFYSVLNHANYHVTGSGLEVIYLQTCHSLSQVSKIYLHLLLPLLPADRTGANLAIWQKKSTVWLICLPSSRLFCCWHHHLSFNVVGGGFETCVHIYHANSLLSGISPHAFFLRAILPEGRTFIMADQSR